MNKKPLILDIKGNSLDDGPGIRTVVFFKGCPLSCVWCHNPESKKPGREISFDPKECVGCDTCIKTCPENALDRKNQYFIDRNKCTFCGECADTCPSGALSLIGRESGISDIVAAAVKDKPFFDNSGGGVTLSGGEPTLHMDFLSELLQQLKAEGIHTLLETCGLFNFQGFEKKILPHIDMIYYDIKIIDPDRHQQFCGVKNDQILANFVKLKSLSSERGIDLLPRTPLIPDITATEQNLEAIAEFLSAREINEARLLAYNPLWLEKNTKIGMQNTFENTPEMNTWIERQRLEHFRTIFTAKGIQTE